MTWRVARAVACGLAAMLVPAAAAPAQQPAPTAPVVLDGPSPDIALPSGLAAAVARDGTGGVVYLKQAGGAEHVFLSPFVGGSFGAPTQVDAGLVGSSSDPVIASGNGGLLLVAFLSGGDLYVVSRRSAQAPLSPPQPLAAGAGSPAISISNFGKAYLAFTVADGSGSDIRAAYYDNGSWGLEPAPLNVTPGDDAGAGAGRPAVATAGDGVGIVAWGENGGIYSRRVWGTSPSIVHEQADGSLPGCQEVSADLPVVGTEGDSSYADVAFHETLACGAVQQSRVLMNRLRASSYDGITQPDGLAPGGPGDATDPQITMGEYGHGLVSSVRSATNDVYATVLGDNGSSGATFQVNGEPDSVEPYPVPATAGLFSDLIAWQQAPASSGGGGIVVRYAPAGSALGPEIAVSSPAQGPTDAGDGLAATGDVQGDVLVAWVQGSQGGQEIVAARLYQPPGPFGPSRSFHYQRTARPRLGWSPAPEAWGPVTYTVTIDGVQVGETTATSFAPPAPLADGAHTWQVSAANPAGQQSTARAATVFTDTVSPTVAVAFRARVRLGRLVKLHITYVDLPQRGEPASDASGIARVVIGWGDGSRTVLRVGRHYALHLYRRARRYTVRITVTDRAGNATTVRRRLRVLKPRPHGRRP